MKKKIVIGNWKMNPSSSKEAKKIFKDLATIATKLKRTEMVICSPAPYWRDLRSQYKGKKLGLGAQNVYPADSGAHTGELSIAQLQDFKISHCLVGHSERRAMGETDEFINEKITALIKANIIPILCIGEKERDSEGRHLQVLRKQLETDLKDIHRARVEDFIIAYEPIWAIGAKAKRVVTSHELHEMVVYIRKVLSEIFGVKAAQKVQIIYGGSVNAKNAVELAEHGFVDGFLPGRASLSAEAMTAITNVFEK